LLPTRPYRFETKFRPGAAVIIKTQELVASLGGRCEISRRVCSKTSPSET
jgi:hypothetical protein